VASACSGVSSVTLIEVKKVLNVPITRDGIRQAMQAVLNMFKKKQYETSYERSKRCLEGIRKSFGAEQADKLYEKARADLDNPNKKPTRGTFADMVVAGLKYIEIGDSSSATMIGLKLQRLGDYRRAAFVLSRSDDELFYRLIRAVCKNEDYELASRLLITSKNGLDGVLEYHKRHTANTRVVEAFCDYDIEKFSQKFFSIVMRTQ